MKQEPKQLAAGQASADHGPAGSADAMHLKDRFGEIETNARHSTVDLLALLAARIDVSPEH